ncbi:hypothetical protein T484DRAFT_1823159 [Baffinella frigidus]|nr:hypothetical protein T484DRAFT_1823159 [Cryptophyta sp. CCMP2293]
MTNAALNDLCKAHKVTVKPSGGRSTPLKEDLVQALLAGTPHAHPKQSDAFAASRLLTLTSEALGVGGLELEVAQLQKRVWLPHVAPAEVSARLDVSPPLGLLLHGPPGCGKSLLAVRLARCLSKRPPLIVKGPELKSSLHGQDEQKIRGLFEVILDEAEALLGSRREDCSVIRGSADSHNTSIVTQFLSCMDGAAKRLEETPLGM